MARASSNARASWAAIATAIATATARARARASERASAAAAAADARGSSSSCCRRRVLLWVAWVPWVLQRGWGIMHVGVALKSAPRSRAHVQCAAWRRTQKQVSERANAARAHG